MHRERWCGRLASVALALCWLDDRSLHSYPALDLSEHPPDIFSQLGMCGQFPVEYGGCLPCADDDGHRPGTLPATWPLAELPA